MKNYLLSDGQLDLSHLKKIKIENNTIRGVSPHHIFMYLKSRDKFVRIVKAGQYINDDLFEIKKQKGLKEIYFCNVTNIDFKKDLANLFLDIDSSTGDQYFQKIEAISKYIQKESPGFLDIFFVFKENFNSIDEKKWQEFGTTNELLFNRYIVSVTIISKVLIESNCFDYLTIKSFFNLYFLKCLNETKIGHNSLDYIELSKLNLIEKKSELSIYKKIERYRKNIGSVILNELKEMSLEPFYQLVLSLIKSSPVLLSSETILMEHNKLSLTSMATLIEYCIPYKMFEFYNESNNSFILRVMDEKKIDLIYGTHTSKIIKNSFRTDREKTA